MVTHNAFIVLIRQAGAKAGRGQGRQGPRQAGAKAGRRQWRQGLRWIGAKGGRS